MRFADGRLERHWYRPGAAAYLVARYGAPVEVNGARWQIHYETVTAGNQDGERDGWS